jgi:hypothetical protein
MSEMKSPTVRRSILVAVVLASITTQLRAEVVLPTGLAPGSQYEIAFVTADPTTATSSDINYYNNFVRTEANQDPILAGLGVSWNAIASTATVNANTNAPNGGSIPVYNTMGQLVANAAAPLYSETLFGPNSESLINPIAYTQTAVLLPSNTPYGWTCVWTGTDLYWSGGPGTSDPNNPLGSTPFYGGTDGYGPTTQSLVTVGLADEAWYAWLDYQGTALTASMTQYYNSGAPP